MVISKNPRPKSFGPVRWSRRNGSCARTCFTHIFNSVITPIFRNERSRKTTAANRRAALQNRNRHTTVRGFPAQRRDARGEPLGWEGRLRHCGRSTAADEVISEKGPEAMADGPSRTRQVLNLAIS